MNQTKYDPSLPAALRVAASLPRPVPGGPRCFTPAYARVIPIGILDDAVSTNPDARQYNSTRIEPWGYPEATQPITLAAWISRMDSARQWAMSGLDQLHPDVGDAGWKNDIPAEIAHWDIRSRFT